MTDFIFIDFVITLIRWMFPVMAVLSLMLLFKPKLFMDLEKKLSKEFGIKAVNRRRISALEKEKLFLQDMLLKNNRFAGLLCFVIFVFVIIKLLPQL